jgi:hypothetical protein
VIQNSLMRHADPSSHHLVRKPKGSQRPDAVAREVKAGTGRWPRRGALDEFRNEALLSQPAGERETRDSATDNQNA